MNQTSFVSGRVRQSRGVTRVSLRCRLTVVLACALSSSIGIMAQVPGLTGDWNVNASANWTSASWTGLQAGTNYPSGVSAVADVVQDINGTRTLTLDVPVTLGTLRLGDTNATNAFLIGVTGGNALTFDNGGAGAILDHTVGNTVSGGPSKNPSGSDRIDAPVILNDDLTIYAQQNIEFRGPWTGNGNDITLSSTGRATWNALGTAPASSILSGINTLNILNGDVRFNGTPGVANSDLIGATTINLGDGWATTGGSGFRVFPRLILIDMETTQAATLNINGGWFRSDLGTLVPMNGDGMDIWSGAINFYGAANTNIFEVNDAGTPEVHYVSGVIGGTGGFSKTDTGTLNLLAANPILGDIYVQRGGVNGAGLTGKGSLTLSGPNGALTDVGTLVVSRDGLILLQNGVDANSDRVADDAALLMRGAGRFRLQGNGGVAVTETIGAVTLENGTGEFSIDLNDATPQATSLTVASITRQAGAVGQVVLLDNVAGGLGSTAKFFVADGGATMSLFGGGGANGSTTMTIAQGLTGGVNNLADHFITFDSATPN
ncbi:MAG: hypothetical protein KDK99_14445, partial [Verrucomicrobiales bacterium]|nr:hypothetical protein [Verrucomicrobiales bacterium]